MVLCGTKNGSSIASLKNLLSTFIFKSVYDHPVWQLHMIMVIHSHEHLECFFF